MQSRPSPSAHAAGPNITAKPTSKSKVIISEFGGNNQKIPNSKIPNAKEQIPYKLPT
jgi:hypothetical protein